MWMNPDSKAINVCKIFERTAAKKGKAIVIGIHYKMLLKNLSLISEIPITMKKTDCK